MKIIEFNSRKGIYNFELDEVNTSFHAHPAIEIVLAIDGKLKIETPESTYVEVVFAVIDKNVSHKVSSSKGCIKLMMIESNSELFSKLLSQFSIKLDHGIFTENVEGDKERLINEIAKIYANQEVNKTNNYRIKQCLDYLDSSTSTYNEMIPVLKSTVNLSESRLSHIFKEEVGISIKKYLVWSRLKKAFQLFIANESSLYEAALKSGFYDQAHLSKAFKQMLGLNPSEVYNSRMIQD